MSMDNPYDISVKFCPVGQDDLFLVTGGKAHIGAVVTAYWVDGQVQLHYQELPGHREGPLAAELAEKAAGRWKRTVTVVMGIHINQASREEIQEAIQITRFQFGKELDRIRVEETSEKGKRQ